MIINTVEECDRELRRIDFEMELLKLEHKHILELRELLATRSTIVPLKPLTQKVCEILKANPGINGKTVRKALNDDSLMPRQVVDTLAHLRKKGVIENRGGRSQNARWYIKEDQ